MKELQLSDIALLSAAFCGHFFAAGCLSDVDVETPQLAASSESVANSGAEGATSDAADEASGPTRAAAESAAISPSELAEALQAPQDVAFVPGDAEYTDSGLATRVLRAGTGGRYPRASDTVRVHYTGWETDGERFDSSLERGAPAEFALFDVIPGWTEGLQLMLEGEKRRLWIPEDLAYRGVAGRPMGMLVFDVELLAIVDG